ncbi:hypothetical protein HDU97_000406 [Phlyctochytrium planicorne]|nr:hypothetical protein HDU97_000406 [Phlyctochytrium planicorne]
MPQTVTPTQYRILELIQQWNATICVSSRYKDDFKHITDMYRLLSYKGYHFPGLNTEAASVLTPRDTLQTEEELEEQDRIAQGAKLQELLRMGTPAALEQANELMKVMAGYDLESKRDYKKEVNEELGRIEARILQFNEKLSSKRPEDRWTHDNQLEELHAFSISSQSRIQKLITECDDEERTEQLLLINDLINQVIERYREFKDGKSVNSEPIVAPSSRSKSNSSQPPKTNPTQSAPPISLIDFDDNDVGAISLPLSGLSISPSATSPSSTVHNAAALDIGLGFSAPAPTAPAQAAAPIGGSGLDDLLGLFPTQPVGAPAPLGANFGFIPQAITPPATNLIQSAAVPVAQRTQVGFGDLGIFAQSSPQPTPAQATTVDLFKKNGLQIKMALRDIGTDQVDANLTFINTTPVPFTNLNFQVAVPKTMQLKLNPLSGTTVAPLNQAQVKQSFGVSHATSKTIKLKFKLSYLVNGAEVEESGDYPAAV